MTRVVVIALGVLLATNIGARADTLAAVHMHSVPDSAEVLPREQWTPQAHVWLARAFIAEAGWKAVRDHAGIAHVLARRWRQALRRWPSLRFVDVVRNYCAGLGDFRRSPTPRQLWVRALRPGFAAPVGWPQKASWEAHRPLWRAALVRARDWQRGRLEDPCHGRAWHWGGRGIDQPHGRMQLMDCGETRNDFYTLGSKP